MSAKILLSIVALGGVGLAALPADVLQKPTREPVVLRLDQTPVTQQVASLAPVAPPMPAKPVVQPAPVATATPVAATAPVAAAAPVTPPAFPPANTEVATVGSSNLNARQGPATSYDKVFVVPAGEQVAVLDKQGTWVQVKRSSGETGWVHSSYLVGGERAAPAERAAPRERAVAAQPERRVITQRERRVADAEAPRRSRADKEPVQSKRAMLAGSVLFASPSRSSQPISRVEKGERLRVGERRGDWVRVVTSDGYSGWLLVR